MNIENTTTRLSEIYNTLSLIATRGQETLIMAECLKALNEVIANINSVEQENEDE